MFWRCLSKAPLASRSHIWIDSWNRVQLSVFHGIYCLFGFLLDVTLPMLLLFQFEIIEKKEIFVFEKESINVSLRPRRLNGMERWKGENNKINNKLNQQYSTTWWCWWRIHGWMTVEAKKEKEKINKLIKSIKMESLKHNIFLSWPTIMASISSSSSSILSMLLSLAVIGCHRFQNEIFKCAERENCLFRSCHSWFSIWMMCVFPISSFKCPREDNSQWCDNDCDGHCVALLLRNSARAIDGNEIQSNTDIYWRCECCYSSFYLCVSGLDVNGSIEFHSNLPIRLSHQTNWVGRMKVIRRQVIMHCTLSPLWEIACEKSERNYAAKRKLFVYGSISHVHRRCASALLNHLEWHRWADGLYRERSLISDPFSIFP